MISFPTRRKITGAPDLCRYAYYVFVVEKAGAWIRNY